MRRTCLHSVLQLLDSALPAPSKTNGPSTSAPKPEDEIPYTQNPRLMERCLALLYKLCVNPESAKPTFRYLRACSDFLARHVSFVKGTLYTKTGEITEREFELAELIRIIIIINYY